MYCHVNDETTFEFQKYRMDFVLIHSTSCKSSQFTYVRPLSEVLQPIEAVENSHANT